MSEADAELVRRIRSGDAAAFETLMRRHFRMAYLIAFAQLNTRADAEDACQDAFFQVWRRISDCRSPARVGAWIAAVARNTARNRRAFLRLRETESLEAAAHVPATIRTDADPERDDLRARLSAALQLLSVTQREVVLLHDLEGWKHREIANRLGISDTMSRRHLSDARRALRATLGAALPTLAGDHD